MQLRALRSSHDSFNSSCSPELMHQVLIKLGSSEVLVGRAPLETGSVCSTQHRHPVTQHSHGCAHRIHFQEQSQLYSNSLRCAPAVRWASRGAARLGGCCAGVSKGLNL